MSLRSALRTDSPDFTPVDPHWVDETAFRHLLHDMASRMSGLGVALDLLTVELERFPDLHETACIARFAADDLRDVIAEIGGLTQFLARHGALVPTLADAGAIVSEAVRDSRVDCRITAVDLFPGAHRTISADRAVLVRLLSCLIRTGARQPGAGVSAGTSTDSQRGTISMFVEVDEPGARLPAQPGARRGASPSLVLDHLCARVATDLGGSFGRQAAPGTGRVILTLPLAW